MCVSERVCTWWGGNAWKAQWLMLTPVSVYMYNNKLLLGLQ